MGACGAKAAMDIVEEVVESAESRELQEQMNKEQREEAKIIKLLVLGRAACLRRMGPGGSRGDLGGAGAAPGCLYGPVRLPGRSATA